jgi:hypothetical protein
VEHLSIAGNLMATVVLLVVASFTATLEEFNESYSGSGVVCLLKVLCLMALLLRMLVNVLGHTFAKGQHLTYFWEIFYNYSTTVGAFIDISTFLLLILFTIFPQSRQLSIFMFMILTLLFMRAASETIHL